MNTNCDVVVSIDFTVGLDGGWEICDLFGEILFEKKMAKLSRTQCFISG